MNSHLFEALWGMFACHKGLVISWQGSMLVWFPTIGTSNYPSNMWMRHPETARQLHFCEVLFPKLSFLFIVCIISVYSILVENPGCLKIPLTSPWCVIYLQPLKLQFLGRSFRLILRCPRSCFPRIGCKNCCRKPVVVTTRLIGIL